MLNTLLSNTITTIKLNLAHTISSTWPYRDEFKDLTTNFNLLKADHEKLKLDQIKLSDQLAFLLVKAKPTAVEKGFSFLATGLHRFFIIQQLIYLGTSILELIKQQKGKQKIQQQKNEENISNKIKAVKKNEELTDKRSQTSHENNGESENKAPQEINQNLKEESLDNLLLVGGIEESVEL